MTMTSIADLGLSLLLGVMIFLFIFRIILTWYPQVDLNQFPVCLISWPTEPFLAITRKVIPPLGGVDITPIIWVGIMSFLREILLGQQGLITLLTSRPVA
jgi:YggT family protein